MAVPLDRPPRGATRTLTVRWWAAEKRLQPGDKAVVEFFYPGEQAHAHCAGAGHPPQPTPNDAGI